MKLFRNLEKNIDKELTKEMAKVILMYCNLVNNNYQQTLKVLFTFMINKQFGELITISSCSLTNVNYHQSFHSQMYGLQIKIESFGIEYNVNLTLIIGNNI